MEPVFKIVLLLLCMCLKIKHCGIVGLMCHLNVNGNICLNYKSYDKSYDNRDGLAYNKF